jgi:hypothetical protein
MAKALKHSKAIKPKKKCCKDRPRCKRCPVVLKRLQTRGFAERREDGNYVIVDVLTKKDLKAARRHVGR